MAIVRPTIRCVLIATGGIPVAVLAAAVDARLWPFAAGFLALTLLLTGLDGLATVRPRGVRIEVTAPPVLYIADRDPLAVSIATPYTSRPTEFEVLPELSVEAAVVSVPARGTATTEIPLAPVRRGTANIRAVWLRTSGPFGLVRRVIRHPVDVEVAVIPNVRAVRIAAIRFFRSKEFVQGLKTDRYLGDGSEFDSLREFQPGFDSRTIDWKSSARHMKLVAREFRAERNHQIVLAVDCGHLMREPLSGVPKVDHAINASLLLAYTALKTGDRVGLFAFDARVRLFLEPRGGMESFPRIQRITAGIDYSGDETNFTLGLLSLTSRLRRRTLVVVFTDFVDSVSVELMVENLGRLSQRHLVLCVTLVDPVLEDLASARPGSLFDLNRAVVAGELIRERRVVLGRLRRMGIHCLESPASAVSSQLLNRYLDIRRRELV